MKQVAEAKRKSLSRNLMTGIMITVLLICDIMAFHGFLTFRREITNRYQNELKSLLDYVLGEIDGDDLEKCMESGILSEKCTALQYDMNRIAESFNIEQIYIIKPLAEIKADSPLRAMGGISAEASQQYKEETGVVPGELAEMRFTPEMVSTYEKCIDSDKVLFFNRDSASGPEYTGLIRVCDSEGVPFAIMGADISLSRIKKVFLIYSLIVGVWVWIMVTVVCWLMIRWLKKRVTRPLNSLKDSAEQFVELSHRTEDPSELIFMEPDIPLNDEIKAVSESVQDMVTGLKRYMTDLISVTKDKERIGAELNVAASIQTGMLPKLYPTFSERDDISLYASMEPAKEVGGDFYDFFFLEDGRLVLVMADVSGKGVPAALFMARAKTLIRSWMQMGYEPADALYYVNNQLCDGNDRGMFVTAWLSVIDLKTGQGIAVNAGHSAPCICRKGGKFELVEYQHDMMLAVMEGKRFRQHRFTLAPGDSLFVYTDGVSEAINEKEQLFGSERMLEALNEDPAASPQTLLKNVRTRVDDFAGSADQFDDITMMCLRINEQ